MSQERYHPCSRKLAARFGICFITLKRWIYQQKIQTVKTIGRRDRIPESGVFKPMGEEPMQRKRAVIHARVSPYDQVKDGGFSLSL